MYNGKEIGKKLNTIFVLCFLILMLISITGVPYLFLH